MSVETGLIMASITAMVGAIVIAAFALWIRSQDDGTGEQK
jgi:hypothetical protein